MLDETFLKDLELGIIKCVGDADTRFKEDALRMLRAIRFSAQLGYSIETEKHLMPLKEMLFNKKYLSRKNQR